jgi:hypothetical protein
MDLAVAIETAAINGKYIQSFSGGGRMARQHMNMALLAHQVSASSQQLGIVRTMRRVTVHAILAYRWMVPKKRAPFFGMAGVTHAICGMFQKHFAPLTSMSIVAGRAADLHVAKLGSENMGRALEHGFPLISVAA